jgi:phage terminase small subunit
MHGAFSFSERGETMTEKQKRFCDEYLIDLNATQAAIRAGYSQKSAYCIGEENLRKPEVRAYIDEQLAKIHNEKTADAAEVMEYLTAVMRGEHTEEVLCLDGDGTQRIANIDVPAKERLKAAELLGKRYGMFTDKVDTNAPVTIVIKDDYGE